MNNNLNELIDVNLKLIFESKEQSLLRFSLIDIDGNKNNDSENLARILEQERLIDIRVNNCLLSKFGREVSNNGGWIKHLETKDLLNQNLKEKNELKEQLEFDIAKSNLKANKLNKKIAEQNAKNEKSNIIATWINVVVGIINIGLFVWQALKD